MKPNTELNTMMFFDDALEGELSLIHIPSPRDMRRSRMPSSA